MNKNIKYSFFDQTNADFYLKELNKRRNQMILFATIHLNLAKEKLYYRDLEWSLKRLKKLFFHIGQNLTTDPKVFIRASYWGKLHFHILLFAEDAFDEFGNLNYRHKNYFSPLLTINDKFFISYCKRMFKTKFKNECSMATMHLERFAFNKYKQNEDAIHYTVYQKTKPEMFKRFDLSQWFTDESNYLICYTNMFDKLKQQTNKSLNQKTYTYV